MPGPSQGPAGEAKGEENHRTKFYEHYRKEAEEYDKEFLKNREEDLNTTLIFVRMGRNTMEVC
jgi:hypothetical protein